MVYDAAMADTRSRRRYVVVTRRALRGTARTARDAMSGEPDVTIVGASDPHMVTIETTPDRAEELRRKLDATHFVEPEVRHRLL